MLIILKKKIAEFKTFRKFNKQSKAKINFLYEEWS